MSNELRVLLVEDEFMTRRLLKRKLAKLGHKVIAEADGFDEAREIAETLKKNIDVAILDINLGAESKDGIWFGEYLRVNTHIPFIYLTAYETSEIVDRAISTGPDSYLTKPVGEVALKTTLALINQKQHATNQDLLTTQLVVKDDDRFLSLNISKIEWFESTGNYLRVKGPDGVFSYRSTVKEILRVLPAAQFVQTHRAYIANINFITKFDSLSLLVNGYEIPISRTHRNDVLAAIKRSAK